jgi:hypothetical protein
MSDAEDEEEEAAYLAFQEKLKQVAEEAEADDTIGTIRNTKSIDMRMYGVSMQKADSDEEEQDEAMSRMALLASKSKKSITSAQLERDAQKAMELLRIATQAEDTASVRTPASIEEDEKELFEAQKARLTEIASSHAAAPTHGDE